MKITFPWPPKELSPNARVHWAVKAEAAKLYKQECVWLCFNAGWGGEYDGVPGLVLVITFRPKSKRRQDIDNMLSSIKPLIDALSWWTTVDDSNFQLVITKGEPVKDGSVEVEIQSRDAIAFVNARRRAA